MEMIKKLVDGKDLTAAEAAEVMEGMMAGSFTPAQSAAILVALKMKGETVEEIAEFARVMRKHAVNIRPNAENLVDTCGTGGDSSHTFNISTAAALIAAGAGASIAKHGNRSVSSKSGSADVLEALGVKMLQPQQVEKCIDEVGFGFMFAPYFHPAMKNVMPVRKELGVRTVFNILGPLTNPAGAKRQVLGVFDRSVAEKMAGVLSLLGTKHALVVHCEGVDEIGFGTTQVYELKGGDVESYTISAADFGIAKRSIPICQSREESAAMISEVLSGKQGAALEVSLLNAAAALYVAGASASIASGISLAQEAVDSGKAMKKLEQLKGFTGE